MKRNHLLSLWVLLVAFTFSLLTGSAEEDLFKKGREAFKNKQYQQAYDLLKKAVVLKPGKANYHYQFGRAARKLKRYREAYDAFMEAQHLDPEFSFAKNKEKFQAQLAELKKSCK